MGLTGGVLALVMGGAIARHGAVTWAERVVPHAIGDSFGTIRPHHHEIVSIPDAKCRRALEASGRGGIQIIGRASRNGRDAPARQSAYNLPVPENGGHLILGELTEGIRHSVLDLGTSSSRSWHQTLPGNDDDRAVPRARLSTNRSQTTGPRGT